MDSATPGFALLEAIMIGSKLLSLLVLWNVLASSAHADREARPEEQVFARAKVIADVSISEVDAEGYVSLNVHEYMRGDGIPRGIKAGKPTKCESVNIGSLAGGRYILFAVRERLYSEEFYRVRLNADGRREVQYQHTWISFDNFKKRIPEPVKQGERDPLKVLAAVSVFGAEAFRQADVSLRHDHAFMRVAVLLAPSALAYASPQERGHRGFMLEATRRNPAACYHAHASLWKDRAFIREVARLTKGAAPLRSVVLRHTPSEVRDDRDLILELVRHNGHELEWASRRLRADREVVEAAGGVGLCYADPALLDDRALVLKLVAQHGDALSAASYRLKSDREVVLAAVRSRGSVLGQLPERFRADRDVVLAAVGSYGDSLMWAGEALKNDREVVLAAVRNWPRALRWASPQMGRSPEIGMEAVRREGYAIQHVHPDNPGIRRIALEALREEPNACSHMPHDLLQDPAFLREAVPLSPRIVGRLPDAIRRNETLYKELLLSALENDEIALAGAPGAMVGDPDFIARAGEKRFYALAYAQGRAAKDPRVLAMKDDRKRVERAIEQSAGYALGAASVRLQTDPDLVRKALSCSKIDGKYLGRYLHPSVWKDRKIAVALLKAGPLLLAGAPWQVRADREMVLAAVEQDGAAFSVADRVLRADREVVLVALRSRPDLAKEILCSARGGVQWDEDVRKHAVKDITKASRGQTEHLEPSGKR